VVDIADFNAYFHEDFQSLSMGIEVHVGLEHFKNLLLIEGNMDSAGTIRIAMLGASLTIRGGITSVEKLVLENTPENISIIHLPTFDHGPIFHNTIVYWNTLGKLCRLIFTGQIDAIHIHFSDRGSTIRKLLPCIIAIIFRRPFILHSHCAVHREFYASIPRIAREVINAVFRKCAYFISLSKSWDDYFTECLKLSPGRHGVLYNPVKISPNVFQKSHGPLVTFVFLGVLGSYTGANASVKTNKKITQMPGQNKGGFDCIKAFALLSGELREKSRMVIAGSGDIQGARDLIIFLGLENKISVRPWLNPRERDELLFLSDVFLLPSYNEGLPMSMLEAMAFGLPVLVTPVGGIPEIVTHGHEGLIVLPGHIDELSHAMGLLIGDKKKREEMGKQALLRVAPLCIENYMDSLRSIYHKASCLR